MTDLKSSDRCVLCLDQKRSPVRIQCGHSFCRECLDVYKTYQKYAWANKCPICRSKLKEKKHAVKRKYSTINAAPENLVQNPETQTNQLEEMFTLEELWTWAANNADNENPNPTPDQEVNEYEEDMESDDDSDESETTFAYGTEDDEFDDYNDDYFDDDYYEVDNENYMNISTDSTYYETNYSIDHADQSTTDNYQEEVVNYDVAEAQTAVPQQPQYFYTDYNNNMSNTSILYDNTDWEEAIANEIIIID